MPIAIDVVATFDGSSMNFSRASGMAKIPPRREPPMETTATPDLEAQTAAQPSDEAASALISEPVELQTEEEKAQIDQADMRRRIEETRNRLKAKAFDAMASGEAALLARDAEGHEAPVVPEEHIDADVADALDRSLSPDDY